MVRLASRIIIDGIKGGTVYLLQGDGAILALGKVANIYRIKVGNIHSCATMGTGYVKNNISTIHAIEPGEPFKAVSLLIVAASADRSGVGGCCSLNEIFRLLVPCMQPMLK